MEELDPAIIAKRSIRGVFAFVSRSFFIQAVNFLRDFLLAIFLTTSAYGVYYIVESLISILSYFSDIGLAGALIQKKEPITEDELSTTFIVQTTLVLTLCVIVFLLSNHISEFFHFPKEGIYLLEAFVFSFFLSSLKTIPSVILERNLEFGRFVIPQVVETLFYTSTVVILAYKGFGIRSFIFAVLLRGISGLIAMYIIKPWRVRIKFSKKALSHLLFFGVPFQLNSILALIKDNLLIIFLGRVLPLEQIGYIAFAQKWAFVPLRQVMDNLIRVTFSSFSRLQHDRVALGIAFEKSILAGTSLIFPALTGLVVVAPFIMQVVPKYQKWEPALLSLTFFAINALLASILVPLTNLLNAIGKIKITLHFMIGWTIITWVSIPFAIQYMGFNGYAFITAIINLSVIPIVFIARKYLDFNLIKQIKNPIISSAIMGTAAYFLTSHLTLSIQNLLGIIISCVILYFSIIFLLAKKQMLSDIKFIKNNLRK